MALGNASDEGTAIDYGCTINCVLELSVSEGVWPFVPTGKNRFEDQERTICRRRDASGGHDRILLAECQRRDSLHPEQHCCYLIVAPSRWTSI